MTANHDSYHRAPPRLIPAGGSRSFDFRIGDKNDIRGWAQGHAISYPAVTLHVATIGGRVMADTATSITMNPAETKKEAADAPAG